MGVCISKDSKAPEIETPMQDTRPIETHKFQPQQSMSSQPEVNLYFKNPFLSQLRRGEKKRAAKIEVLEEFIYENVTKKLRTKTPTDYQIILNAFENHFMFAQIQNEDKEKLIEKMFYCTTQDGEFVFKQGDKASLFFVIERGQCQVIINNEIKKILYVKEQFGELALMYSAPRSASVRANGMCGFWVLERSKFRKAVEDIQIKAYEQNRQFIDQVKFFDFMTEEQRDSIANVLIALRFKNGEIIVSEGDMANSFYIIKSGEVVVTKEGQFLRHMKGGDSFGEQALFGNCVRGATVKANQEKVEILSLSREDITNILGEKIQLIIYTNMQKWAFEKHPKLRDLTKMQIEKIVSHFKYKTYEANEIVYKKDEQVDKLIIILDGQLLQKNADATLLNNGQLFGEAFLSIEQARRRLNIDIVTTRKTTLSELDFTKFFECIGGELEVVMKKNQERVSSVSLKEKRQRSDYSQFNLEDFLGLTRLGSGQFGSVYLVQNTLNNQYFAMKCLSKKSVIQQNTEKYVQNEKQVLEHIGHNMIINYHRSFKDKNYVYIKKKNFSSQQQIYFLLEYIKGQELFEVIREIGILNTFETQFYIASIILCLEHLHYLNTIYRDVKPENIMVTENGFIKLIDMGTAKILKSKASKTFTIIGTPHYMAPEILRARGYTYSSDLWSLGICFYEFMCGEVPFAEEEEDPFVIQDAILNQQIKYPPFLKDAKAIKLMDQLLNRTPELRLGGSYGALKVHTWFDHFDWEQLENFEIEPPYRPKQKIQQYQSEPFSQMILKDTSKESLYDLPNNPEWDQEY